MKKILFTILLFGFTTEFVLSQAFEARMVINSNGYLEYQLRETTGINPPSQATPITDITFIVRWSTALGDPLEINVVCTTPATPNNNYNLIEGFPNAQTQGAYYYKLFGAEPTPVYPPADSAQWTQNAWQSITAMKISNPTPGTGDFALAPVGFIGTDINFSYDSDLDGTPEDYTPTLVGDVTGYPYPTTAFDRVWTGVNSAAWNSGGNWVNQCGVIQSAAPTTSTSVLIPDVDDENGNAFNPATSTGALNAKSLTIFGGGYLKVATLRTLTVTQATVVNADGILEFVSGTAATQTSGVLASIELKPSALRAAGAMIINPYAKVTASGPTTLSAPSQLQLLANASSTGSFIDNGTITYVTGGSANVQAYIKNSGAPGSYYAHLVGPMVNDPAFQTAYGYPGVYLGAFDLVGLGTYAYEYNEPVNDWTNIFSVTYPVRSTKGILLSTIDATNHTLTQTGQLVTGTLSSAALSHGGTNNLELLSNPYPSSLDFSLLSGANTNITNKYYVYDPVAGTYKWFIVTGGGSAGVTKNIQIGQGFFVETLSSAPVTFTNAMRLHSTATFFKDEFAYQLRLHVAGNGFADETHIFFKPEGNWGYDQMHDVYKWFSLLPEATEVWTVANDQSVLSLNSIPPLDNNMVSVPMGFKCSVEGTYTITAENIGSFDAGTTIYLEDLATGAEWYDLVANPVYAFNATPDGDQNRFIVHFFGPTGINDPDGANLVKIYGWGQDAYIVNRGKETIKEYVVYDLMGRELQRGSLPNSTVNKVTIGDVSAYYIVKAITKEGRIYTDKVYITK
jgi:hypothetical protein